MKKSLKLSEEGKRLIEEARLRKGWNKTDPQWLILSGYMSESTLKRFLQGKPVSPPSFKVLSEAVGIEEWQNLVDWEDRDSTRVIPLPVDVVPEEELVEQPQSKGSIAITGVFDEDQRQEIEVALEHLKGLLRKCSVTIK